MKEYRVGDAVELLEDVHGASLVHLDDAWARPGRCNMYGNDTYGVSYDTHPFSRKGTDTDVDVTTTELIDASFCALESGGWLIVTCDDWLLPRVIDYLRDAWGDVNETYSGGGYRKTGRVVYLKSDGTPHRGGAGMYFRQAGYPVVFAHKGETDRKTTESAVQLTEPQTEEYGWGTVKPVAPYEAWVDALTEQGDLVVEPCAGTAPACVASERLCGSRANYVAIDTEEDARAAFERRRAAEVTEAAA